ncbi:PLP-dependent aminotransferase family protein [Jannaschia rubra]|uniref:aminotransferase-like domain-containing protein n=1 Tax=Jannaschia rubra TaxID=282197 RepID=UPI00249206B1|nr:PLP-dependent aminotransferase family protein [Jannaschia rubra]
MASTRIPAEIFFLDRNSPRSLQAQIREVVVGSILSGLIHTGARMPSSRGLARHLGIARMTVTLAYQELVAQGYLNAKDRSAYVVAEVESDQLARSADASAKPAGTVDWSTFLAQPLRDRRAIRKRTDWRKFRYPFLYGQLDTRLFDRRAWRECLHQATGHRDFDDMAGDFVSADDPLLVTYIRTRTLPRRGISATSDEILVTVGAQNALWLVVELLSRGPTPLRAVCENPGYPDTIHALRWCGADVTTVEVDDNGLPPQDIPPGTRAVFVTPSHQSPTGVTMRTTRRKDLLQKAAREDFVIVEDDYDAEMSFLAAPGPALKSYDRAGRVLYVGSFSKVMFPGLRLGYLVGPAEVIAEARELASMILRHPPGHLQRAAAYFLSLGHYDRQIRNMRSTYAARQAALRAALAGTSLSIVETNVSGGSCLWVRGPDGLDSDRLARALIEDSVLIEPGGPFFHGSDGPTEWFRLGYSSIEQDRIAPGVALIEERIQAMMT